MEENNNSYTARQHDILTQFFNYIVIHKNTNLI